MCDFEVNTYAVERSLRIRVKTIWRRLLYVFVLMERKFFE